MILLEYLFIGLTLYGFILWHRNEHQARMGEEAKECWTVTRQVSCPGGFLQLTAWPQKGITREQAEAKMNEVEGEVREQVEAVDFWLRHPVRGKAKD